MKGLIRGAAGLAIVLGLSACNSDETVDLMGPPTGVQATPASVILADGDSTAVLVRLVNDRNQAVPTSFTISNVSPTLVVKYDDKFRPDYTGGDTLIAPTVKPEQRYFVLGVGLGVGQFDITSEGKTTTVKVTVMPGKLKNVATALTPALGDTITLTAPAGTRFTAATRFVSARGTADSAAIIVANSYSADSTTVKIIPQVSLNGPLTVTNLVLLYNPAIPVNRAYPTAQSFVTTPLPANLGANALNITNPALGAPVTVTAPTGWIFLPTAVPTVENGPSTPVPVVLSRSADSTSITFIPIPGNVTYSGRVFVTNMVARRLPFAVYGRQVASTQQLTVLPVPALTAVFSSTTPAVNQVVTVTAASFKFLPSLTVTFAGKAAFVVSVAADSLSAQILAPTALTAAVPVFSNLVISGLPSVTLSNLSSLTTPFTVGSGYATLGAATAARIGAPSFAVSAAGTGIFIQDSGPWTGADVIGGGGPLKWYQLTVAAAGTRSFRTGWNNGADIDSYLANSTGGLVNTAGGTSANPEVFSQALTAGGTFYIVDVLFAGAVPTEVLHTIK